MYTGSCLCKGAEYRIDIELPPIQICHCRQCQKAQGTAIASNVATPRQYFQLIRGEGLITEFESSPGKKRCFCKTCGSPLFSYRDALPDTLRIRVGLINEAINTTPEAHFHISSKCQWWSFNDDLMKYPAGYDSEPFS